MANKHELQIVKFSDIVSFRLETESVLRRFTETRLPVQGASFRVVAYQASVGSVDLVALVAGDITGARPVPTYVHKDCVMGDGFGSRLCECSNHLSRALDMIRVKDRGCIVYLTERTGNGDGLFTSPRFNEREGQAPTADIKNGQHGLITSLHTQMVVELLKDLGIESIETIGVPRDPTRRLSSYGFEVNRLDENIPEFVLPSGSAPPLASGVWTDNARSLLQETAKRESDD